MASNRACIWHEGLWPVSTAAGFATIRRPLVSPILPTPTPHRLPVQALVQQRAAAELELAAAREAGEAEAAARWQGRVTDLRKQVGLPVLMACILSCYSKSAYDERSC